VIKISEEYHLDKKIEIQPQEDLCSCGCKGQEKVDFEKVKQKRIIQLQCNSNK
jgi:hypothetical protein